MASSVLSSQDLRRSDESDFTIRVFTSKHCEHSKVALGQAHYVAEKLNRENLSLEVVESSVDDEPTLLEAFNILALPMTVVNDCYLIGVPSSEELESIIQSQSIGTRTVYR